jgi:hypothetical protein
MKGRLVARVWPYLALALAGTFILSACDIMGARNRPERLRVIADHENLQEPVRMIVSRQFVRVQGQTGEQLDLEFFQADTLLVQLPIDTTFSMAPTYMLAVRFLAPEAEWDPVPRVMMEVRVDGRNAWSGDQAMFPGAYIEYYLRHSL